MTKYTNMEFKGRVVGKQYSIHCSPKGHCLRIHCGEGTLEPDFTLPGELYEILESGNEIVCRVTEAEYNSIQIGDSVVKTIGIEGAFQKITEKKD